MASLDDRKDDVNFAFVDDTLGNFDVLNSEDNVNQIVYKLVRVQGDGTLVPATEDEVEHLLDDERYQKSPKAQKKHADSEDSPSLDSFVEDGDVTGMSEPDEAKEGKRKLFAKLQFIAAMLQRVNEEEQMKLNSGLPESSRFRLSRFIRNRVNRNHSRISPDSMSHVLSADAPSQESPSPVNSGYIDERAEMEKNSDGSTTPQPTVMGKPDHTSMKQDICLDNLSIRELHEAFRRTFGRETSVKDKQWLKRRISLGLHNSPDGSSSVLIENRNPSIQKQDKCFTSENQCNGQYSVIDIQPIRSKMPSGSVPEAHGTNDPFGNNGAIVSIKGERDGNEYDNEVSGHCGRAGKRLRKPKLEYKYSEYVNTELSCNPFGTKSDYEYGEVRNREKLTGKRVADAHVCSPEFDDTVCHDKVGGKRVRKPTRRYIEELSEDEPRGLSGKTSMAVRDSDSSHSPTRSNGGPIYLDGPEELPLATSQDSIGLSGDQDAFIPRMRRGRPRKNCTSLMKYCPNGMAAKLVKKALSVRAARHDGDSTDTKWRPRDLTKSFEEEVGEDKKQNENMLMPVTTEGSISDPLGYDIEEDNSDDYVATVPTAKGGTRRKHHRAWTLGEVMKLVEGVSRCGAGRWSEIKRLAFSTYGHRTSVDLKDKWRNLLRASYAQLQSNKEGKAQRKHASVPIPTPILVRVRELAAMQSQALGNSNSNPIVQNPVGWFSP
eukprot:TRINITY_DN1402_c0_g1_i1.p1 TRINITY_DN1402_c0_g1~~TRINITY_DN1402_c0_g1_i1.p1  ORF type:complete len:716 (-),score=149.08 TRINITY_DN1402_c0_g1_i1:516-2663(-)